MPRVAAAPDLRKISLKSFDTKHPKPTEIGLGCLLYILYD